MGHQNNCKSSRYFLLFALFTFIFPLKVFAVPAYKDAFELRQPNGISFEARKRGDEWHNWFETKSGYGIYKNKTAGKWEYYMPSDTDKVDIKKYYSDTSNAVVGEVNPELLGIPKGLRPARTSKAGGFNSGEDTSLKKGLQRGLKSAAASGSKYVLVIAVDYADTPATYAASEIQSLFFGSSGSVKDYYSNASYSSVTITAASESYGTSDDGFIGWIRLSGNHPNTGWDITDINQQIAKDAILAADSYINYASYDSDGDGIISPTELSIIIIVAGYEASYGGPYSPSVWAHYMDMTSVGYPSVDGKTIEQYAQFGERHGNHLATIGVMAHELGHLMFSLPDLYDTDTSNGDSEGIGAFDLMAGGAWGAASGGDAGSYPTYLSAWSKEYLSWGAVTTISSNQSVSLPKADGNSSSIFRVNTSDSNQYFLIENRQFSGYDAGFQYFVGSSGHGGLVIYHIDKSKTEGSALSDNEVNADENDKGVDAEEANEGSLGYSMLDTNTSQGSVNMFFFSGNNTSFTNSTTPNSKLKSGASTDISITDISAYGGTMTATVSVSGITHTLTAPSNTTVKQGWLLGPFYGSIANSYSSSQTVYVSPWLYTPDGEWLNIFTNAVTISAGGTNSSETAYMAIPSYAQTGTYYHYVVIYDSSWNTIDTDYFSFTVTSANQLPQSSDDYLMLKQLMKIPDAQVKEKNGWKMIMVPESGK